MQRPPHIPDDLFPGEWKWCLRYGIGLTLRKVGDAPVPKMELIEYLETIHSCHRTVVERLLADIDTRGSGSTTCGPNIHIDWLTRDLAKYSLAVSVGQPWCEGEPVPEGGDPWKP